MPLDQFCHPREIEAAFQRLRRTLEQVPRSRRRLPLTLLGTPAFHFPFGAESRPIAPLGQERRVQEILDSLSSEMMQARTLREEYLCVVEALQEAGITFRILCLERGDPGVRKRLAGQGIHGLLLPVAQPVSWVRFPRDLFVMAEKVRALLVNSRLFQLRERNTGYKILHSRWGEGGRVLLAGDRMLVSSVPDGRAEAEGKVLRHLRELGMRIAVLPNAIFLELTPDGVPVTLFHEGHLDRSASLIRGRDGGYYLLCDRSYTTGLLDRPFSPDRSIDELRRACEPVEVEVRLPRARTLPYATSVVQFEDGRVLVSGGDESVVETLADLVGQESLIVTRLAIRHYPAVAAAGLHCLVTEMPHPLLRKL